MGMFNPHLKKRKKQQQKDLNDQFIIKIINSLFHSFVSGQAHKESQIHTVLITAVFLMDSLCLKSMSVTATADVCAEQEFCFFLTDY